MFTFHFLKKKERKKKKKMLETLRYLMGAAGVSGYGSKSTAEEVTEACSDLGYLTAIITGTLFNKPPNN